MVAKQIISYVDLAICAFIGGAFIYVFFSGWVCFYSSTIEGKRVCRKKKIKPLAKNCSVPPLVGIMMVPFLVYNTAPEFFEGLDHPTNAIIRKAAIGLVLFKAGLGLDLKLLKKVYRPILKLAFLPQLVEACVACFFAVWLFKMPVTLAFAFGYLLAGGSTTVCVPLANNLQDQGYGVDKFIPTIIVLAVTIDAMFALTAVNFLVSLQYTSDNLFGSGPGAAVGLGLFQFFGSILCGVLLAIGISTCFRKCDPVDVSAFHVKTSTNTESFPETSPGEVSPSNSSETTDTDARLQEFNQAKCGDYFEFAVMLIFSMVGLFVPAKLFNMNNFGYVCTVIMNAFLRLFWRNSKRKLAIHARLIGYLFFVGQFLLFGLIGTAIDIASIDAAILVEIVIVIFVCLFLRFGTAYFALGCCEQFRYKERLAVSMTWMAKATVQVALGGLVLDKQEELGLDSPFGADFVGLSVFAILFCAPLGGILGGIFAKRWLTKSEHTKEMSNDDIIYVSEDSQSPVRKEAQSQASQV